MTVTSQRPLTRIPARWVQAIIPPLNSFSFLKVHSTKKIIFLLYFTIEACIQAQTRAYVAWFDWFDNWPDARRARLKLFILRGTASSFWQFWQVFDVYILTYIFMKLNEEMRRGAAHTRLHLTFFNNARWSIVTIIRRTCDFAWVNNFATDLTLTRVHRIAYRPICDVHGSTTG